ncbi:hypothetical protein NDU88_001285 [Pleurodeles waltl]|uniref:Uncharacterized protein n=1 Tax=Pleurodeles waltl TaxID=8319 RepID=A0AAV7MN02_PLEWA|nr:hypothetical protein NDU88_001285 [Pleurodeles waltl]
MWGAKTKEGGPEVVFPQGPPFLDALGQAEEEGGGAKAARTRTLFLRWGGRAATQHGQVGSEDHRDQQGPARPRTQRGPAQPGRQQSSSTKQGLRTSTTREAVRTSATREAARTSATREAARTSATREAVAWLQEKQEAYLEDANDLRIRQSWIVLDPKTPAPSGGPMKQQ